MVITLLITLFIKCKIVTILCYLCIINLKQYKHQNLNKMETQKFIIKDLSATDNLYIAENGINVKLEENAFQYDTKKEAQNVINAMEWEEWAEIIETDCKN